jgi:hypothetical protein
MNTEDRIQELEAKVAQLTALLETQVTVQQEPTVSAAPAVIETTSTEVVEAPRSSRRGLLKLAGAAAAGAAAAAATQVMPAAALDGAVLNASGEVSTTNTSRLTTGLIYTNSAVPQVDGFLLGSKVSANIFVVRDTPGGFLLLGDSSSSGYPAAIGGYSYRTVANGMYGFTANAGYGVVGYGSAATGVGVLARGGKANLELQSEGTAPTSRTDAHNKGEVIADTNGDLWVCIVAGSPGTWRHLAGASTSGSLHLITPKRVYDSRPAEAPTAIGPKTSLAASTRTIDCTGNSSGVPASATGLLLNVTAIPISANGFLAVTPGGTGFTGTSTLNFTAAGAIVANSVTVAAGAGAKVDLTTGGGGNADVIVDVFGYYL